MPMSIPIDPQKNGIAVQAAPVEPDTGAKEIDEKYPADKGWKNTYVHGKSWRVNRWESDSGCGSVVESYFSTVTPDGIVEDAT